jgi:CheY-like chemotaxis protein
MAKPKEAPQSETEAVQRSDKGDVPREPRKRNGAGMLKASFSEYQVLKIVLSVVLFMFALTRFYYYESLSTRMDLVFLALVFSVFLLWMLPWEDLWERLHGFSIGGVAISLEQPDVQGAIGNISFDAQHLSFIFGESSGRSSREARRELIQRIEGLEKELQIVRGSRVLWIDDHPHEILGERRLLRTLGINVTPASSSEEARHILDKDNDFDLIITEVQRPSTPFDAEGRPEHGGVNFIVKLQEYEKDIRISTLPIIFYAAYHWQDLIKHTNPARVLKPEIEISNSVVDLIPKVIKTLSEEREHPITVSAKKTGTSL